MSDVTGPIATLPGSVHKHPDGAVCDHHADRAAVARVQGETDSFGSEMLDVCDECLREIRSHRDVSACDWCEKEAELRHYRDLDEGMAGPVYSVCAECRRKDRDRWDSEAVGDEYQDLDE